ncbi:MAG TPA: hypothetical protein VHR41_09625 [Gemmatimonadales bacterium]|jgi:hypothetical protein|nr:hypothetical protein [Gemmatimonadales bacterium]
MTSRRTSGALASPARRIIAMLLAVVQLVMVLASLTEVPDHAGGRVVAGTGERSLHEAFAPSDPGHERAKHDEATCPACIVRSLHARLEALAPLPISGAEQHTAALPAPASLPCVDPSFSNFSRAPPVVG